jgi:RimJ/RimL family protein N-acetyltransferase
LLEGKNVNLKVVEKEDLGQITEWFNNAEFHPIIYMGPFAVRRAEMESSCFPEVGPFEPKWFFIEKKDGSKIGYIWHANMLNLYMKMLELGYGLVPSERGKGYGTEATQLMVDYLFLSKDIVRIIATTHTKNVISQKVLEKVGFKREGTMRKCYFNRGEWTDMFLFSILREEWKEPRILTKFLR